MPLPIRQSSVDVAQDKGSWTKSLDLTAVTSRTQAQRIMELERKRARRMLIASMTLRAYWNKLEPGDWVTFNSTRAGWVNQTFEITEKTDNEDQSVTVTLRAVDEEVDDWSTSDELADDAVIDLPPGGPTLTTVSGLALATYIHTSGGIAERPGLHATWTGITDPTCVGLLIEYRQIGSDVVLQRRVYDAAFGSYQWVEGVQGATDYEIRAIPVTVPDRPLMWTGWVDSTDITDPQIVDTGGTTVIVPDGSVTPIKLSEQARKELELVTAVDEVQGSVAERLQFVYDEIQRLGSAQLEHRLQTTTSFARVRQTVVEQASDRLSFAQFKIEVEAALAGVEGPIAEAILDLQARVEIGEDGLADVLASATLGINAAGNVALIRLDGTEIATLISFVADEFVFAKPGGAPGEYVQLVTIANVGGEDKLVLNFAEILIPAGSIKAEHMDVVSLDAISANFGSAQFSGVVTSAPGSTATMVHNWNNGSMRITIP
jgi:hypothetical protein